MSSLPVIARAESVVESGIEAAREGDAAALGDVLEVCRNYLLLTANQELQPELQAKVAPSDVVQKTYLEACRDFGQFRGTTEADLLAWLRSILRNNVANARRDYYRTDKRELRRERPLSSEAERVPTGQLTPGAVLAAQEHTDHVRRALEQLPTRYREVLLLRHEQNLSFGEIGKRTGRTGRTAEAARKLWARAVEQLKESLKSSDVTR